MEDVGTLTREEIERALEQAELRLAQKQQNGQTSLTKAQNMEVVKTKTEEGTANETASTRPHTSEVSVRIPRPRLSKQEYLQTAKADAGAGWFNLPKTQLTPELRRELQILKMRDTLDPKRFYRKDNSKAAVPQYSQIGTLHEGPTEFFSARMTKKQRKRTLLEEVLETEDKTRRFKSKYGEIQAAKTSGKKGHYKKMMQMRYGKK